MSPALVDDQLWKLIETLLPRPTRRYRHSGRRRLDDRKALNGVLFVLSTGIAWQRAATRARFRFRHDLLAPPARLAAGRRLRAPPPVAPGEAAPGRAARPLACRLRLQLAVRAFGGDKTGPSPVDRGRAGSKHHLITDAYGIPLACLLTGANRHDVTQLLPLIEAIPAVRGKRGRPRRRPQTIFADRAYDSQPHRRALRALEINPRLARRNTAHGSHLGRERWVVERTVSWLHQYRRLRIRYEHRADIHEAFLTLAWSLISYRQLRSSFWLGAL
jgi:transposase